MAFLISPTATPLWEGQFCRPKGEGGESRLDSFMKVGEQEPQHLLCVLLHFVVEDLILLPTNAEISVLMMSV